MRLPTLCSKNHTPNETDDLDGGKVLNFHTSNLPTFMKIKNIKLA